MSKKFKPSFPPTDIATVQDAVVRAFTSGRQTGQNSEGLSITSLYDLIGEYTKKTEYELTETRMSHAKRLSM